MNKFALVLLVCSLLVGCTSAPAPAPALVKQPVADSRPAVEKAAIVQAAEAVAKGTVPFMQALDKVMRDLRERYSREATEERLRRAVEEARRQEAEKEAAEARRVEGRQPQ